RVAIGSLRVLPGPRVDVPPSHGCEAALGLDRYAAELVDWRRDRRCGETPLKVLPNPPPPWDMAGRSANATRTENHAGKDEPPGDPDRADRKDFKWVYERYFNEVRRWVRAFGGPACDRDDVLQEVFMVVYRR